MMIVLIITAVLVFAMLISAINCTLEINVARYEILLSKLKRPVKLVCISDLHGWKYGKGNSKLINLIAEQKPEAIIIAGDMITRIASDRQICKMTLLIEKLTAIAPVYYATGNHEADYMAVHGQELLNKISATGATVLYDNFIDAQIGENAIRIGGASGRYFDGSERDSITLQMLEEIGADGTTSVAVIHQPENLLHHDGREKWTADLFLSGHTHGGVWRIPGIGGIMAPTQGLFPKYDKGEFLVDGKMPLLINGGLSGYYFIPRVFNRPEICTIKLLIKE